MVDYNQFLEYLYGLQENLVKPGLERIAEACKRFDGPQKCCRSIHIAGTNGKGSTAVFLESILRGSGYKVGLYTSPHLIDPRERIQIDRELISEKDIVGYYVEIRERCSDLNLSYFEFLTLISFLYFSDQAIDFAIYETGLGGRWDATNVLEPTLTIMTPISIDHTSYLGNDILDIATEKAGIIKAGVALVSSLQREGVEKYLRGVCEERKAPFVEVSLKDDLTLSLSGDFQQMNASLALLAADELGVKGNLGSVEWPGRLQLVHTEPEMLLDGAHNVDAIDHLVSHIQKDYSDRDIILYFGGMKDKDLGGMIQRLKKIAKHWFLPHPNYKRMAEPDEFKSLIGENSEVVCDLEDALNKGSRLGLKNPLILVTGSLYLVGDSLKWLEGCRLLRARRAKQSS